MKIRKLLTFVLAGILILASCKKDEESATNYISYDGKKYTLDKGALENYGESGAEGAINIDLTLLSPELTIVEVENEFDDVSGTGHGIYLEMFSNIESQLPDGTYSYDYWSEEAFTFDFGVVFINYSFSQESGETENEIEDGTVTVNKSGEEYEITFDLTDEDGKSVKGHYKGTLRNYDYASVKKTTKLKRKM